MDKILELYLLMDLDTQRNLLKKLENITLKSVSANITLEDIRYLKRTSGASMLDCKNALLKNLGDVEAARVYLVTKGLA